MTDPGLPFSLTAAERDSVVWQKLFARYTKRLVELREQNDGQLDELTTARLRGNIAFCKEFLALARDLPLTSDQR